MRAQRAQPSSKMKPEENEHQIERVRRICFSFPETTEKISHGEPTWFVRKKVFAMFSNNHHHDGHIAVTVPAAIGIQEALIKASPQKFYRPPYVGVKGWIGIEVPKVSDDELAAHIGEAWKLIAPPKLQASIAAEQSGNAAEFQISKTASKQKRRSKL